MDEETPAVCQPEPGRSLAKWLTAPTLRQLGRLGEKIGRKRNHHMLSEHLNHLLLLANLYWTQAPPVADPPVMPPLCLDHSVLDATTESGIFCTLYLVIAL
ncbi:uncharacterized protein LOC144297027 isoform X2 [Canis aureus]